ncbi:hypothetical protein L1987_46737 [Smallanthus sonchifolius]|uniref:Uncharacterized protein n=1 Tax=Smallanthus sonchifolius TaxID=185202 RepID=A0ACB9G1K3_9ASTR|nr:hypothetical protein L1987_46737 [Smallanthus sonchifolius]
MSFDFGNCTDCICVDGKQRGNNYNQQKNDNASLMSKHVIKGFPVGDSPVVKSRGRIPCFRRVDLEFGNSKLEKEALPGLTEDYLISPYLKSSYLASPHEALPHFTQGIKIEQVDILAKEQRQRTTGEAQGCLDGTDFFLCRDWTGPGLTSSFAMTGWGRDWARVTAQLLALFTVPIVLFSFAARPPSLSVAGFRPPAVVKKFKMSSSTLKRWLRPEVYPLFAALGVAVGICGMQLVRNISGNPEVRVTKENRAAGVLDNFSEGEKYAEHSLRLFATRVQK